MTDWGKLGRMGSIKRWSEYNLQIKNFMSNDNPVKKYPLELSMLCGFLAGDGSVGNREIRFYPDDKKVAIIFKELFIKLYGKQLDIKKQPHLYGDCYVLRTRLKKAYKHLLSLAKFGRLRWEVPDFVFKELDTKTAWLRAFFDCEGYVNPNGKVIQIQSVNKSGINQIREMLLSLGIVSGICRYERKNKNWNNNFILSITRRENIENFHKFVGFNHSRKLKTLKDVINKY